MGKLIHIMKKNIRLTIQILFSALSNGYLMGFFHGKIYTGKTKYLCLPGLSCYSCPGALGSCPVGAFQAVISSHNYKFSFYIVGFLIFIGSILGRFVCGWLCPFGLIQELLHKIPSPFKRKSLPFHKKLIRMKYIILIVFVVLLPLTVTNFIGQGKPWFCQYICPAGTLTGGIPLLLDNESLRNAIGFLFTWKMLLLILILLSSIFIHRPFCKYLCPLGAFYGFFNKISLYHLTIDPNQCIHCGKCVNICDMDISVYDTPNSMECIRCGKCVKVCPKNALSSGLSSVRFR